MMAQGLVPVNGSLSKSTYVSPNSGVSQSSLLTRNENFVKQLNGGKESRPLISINESTRARVKEMSKSVEDLQSNISTLQTADKGMQVTESSLKKMRDLAKKATSNNLTAEERKALNNEIKKQQDLLDKAAERANVNGKKLLDGKYNESLQTGATKQFSTRVKIGDMSSKGVGVDKIDLSDVNKAKDALAKIDNALQNVNKERKQVDAVRTKMQETAAIQSKVVESLTGNGGSQNTQSIQSLLEQSKSQINFYNPTSVQNIIKMSANSAQSLLMSKVGGAS